MVVQLTAILSGAALLGFLTGYFWPVLFVTSLIIIVWHYLQLSALIHWLWKNKGLVPPQGKGVWAHVYDGLYRRVRKYRIKLKRQNEAFRRFREGAEALPDAAIVLGKEMDIQWGNKKALILIGVRWPGDAGQRIDNLVRSPEFSKYLARADFDSPCNVISPINAEMTLELRIMPYGNGQYMMLARDVSEYFQLQKMRRDFVANVSHELKTPLTVMRGYLEMFQMSDAELSAYMRKAFSTMGDQVSRMDKLVEQLLQLSKVEQGDEETFFTPIDLSKLARTVFEDAKWLNKEKQHQLSANIEDNLLVDGVESELKSAFSNLVSNAIAYTQEAGEINISLRAEGEKIIFTVTDNGPGIKPEHLDRLTERFYRVDESRSRDTGGSGLGLAIVKHILNRHQGQLSIASKWQHGSAFSIEFDLSKK